jgi:hypothetical protein
MKTPILRCDLCGGTIRTVAVWGLVQDQLTAETGVIATYDDRFAMAGAVWGTGVVPSTRITFT